MSFHKSSALCRTFCVGFSVLLREAIPHLSHTQPAHYTCDKVWRWSPVLGIVEGLPSGTLYAENRKPWNTAPSVKEPYVDQWRHQPGHVYVARREAPYDGVLFELRLMKTGGPMHTCSLLCVSIPTKCHSMMTPWHVHVSRNTGPFLMGTYTYRHSQASNM